ncbi:hypothetical protein [Desulfotomaculum copahuensis]|nr:hypothetical protein [Desulfotomaculum copahuensis]
MDANEIDQLEMSTDLSKKLIIETCASYYNNVEFPESIYIALKHTLIFGKGSVINALDDVEANCFVPVARIDELLLNIPRREEYHNYFKANFNIDNPLDILPEMEKSFWQRVNWDFASNAGGMKIEWV